MATYKLMQDIEAEDHILGPLSLRQFIFALIACFFGYMDFLSITKHVLFLLILFGPPTLFFGFFAFPFGRDQPTEVWFLAKLRFWFLPRRRIWDQSGIKELVTITVPKKIEKVFSDGLSQTEVKSRLQALANTIDSRGWAVKNINAFGPPAFAAGGDADRLIDLNSIPQDVPAYDTTTATDMLDTENNPVAQQMAVMVAQSAEEHHKRLIEEINTAPPPAAIAPPVTPAATSNSWFMGHGAAGSSTSKASHSAPASTASQIPRQPAIIPSGDEAKLAQELKRHAGTHNMANEHLRTLRPGGAKSAAPSPVVPAAANPVPPVTTPSDPAILALANNNDLNVETLARQAKKVKSDDNQHPDEVVISLH